MLRMSTKEAASKLVASSRVTEKSKVVVLGSNYNMFARKCEPDPYCPKCSDSFEIIGPTKVDVFTFEVSLLVRKLLLERGIPTTVLIMPSDYMKGATFRELAELRANYSLPEEFKRLLEEHAVPENDKLFIFESTFKKRAMTILRKIMRDGVIKMHVDSDDAIYALFMEDRLRIPIGRMIEDKGNRFAIPFCQILCSVFYEKMESLGFTDMFGIFNTSEMPCVTNGTGLAQILGFLDRLRVHVSLFQEQNNEFALAGLARFGAGEAPYPFSEILKKDR